MDGVAREEMDGFFGITHRLCVEGKEWVAAFSGPQPVLHTSLCSRIDLEPFCQESPQEPG
ncbi:hypothetical protein LDENG_00282630 [Lucifuga dentata]|nr:hypothetical protein LDENG_00282630 [Lucifuga dentata]